jgi:hypothetical protein
MALWLTLLLMLVAIIPSPINVFAHMALLAGIIILLGMGIHASIKNKNLLIGFYVLIIAPIQVYGYGLGFTWAFIRRILFGHKEFTGFTKKYY